MSNFIEINADDGIYDFERQMLAEVNIISLLPVNIIDKNEEKSLCFITTGYKTISQTEISDIETLCDIIKSFVRSIIISEQFLLMGGKHFLTTDMVFYDEKTRDIKLVFGRLNDKGYHYGDIEVIVEFIENLKNKINDKVYLSILRQIGMAIKTNNPGIKRITVLIEEIERKWYCRNLIPELPFSRKQNDYNH